MEDNAVLIIFVSIIMGTLARTMMMRVDYRQYPSYPQAVVSQLILGFVAACLGAVVTPAFITENYSAVTFLGLATTQFKDIRSMERESLENLEITELIERGTAYIEDIAKRFESRNYIAFLTAFLVCTISTILDKYFSFSVYLAVAISVVIGLLSVFLLDKIMKADTISDIAHVREGKISFKGPLLCVDEIVLMNVGNLASQDIIRENGIGIIIEPKDQNAVATLANIGQRQAIIHNLATQLGIRKDVDEPDFTPLARRQPETGEVGIFILTMDNKPEDGILVAKNVPVLESARRKPAGSKGREG